MRKSIILSLLFCNLFLNYTSSESKIVNYDNKILEIPYSTWLAPFSYYKTALVKKQNDNFIQIDKGEFHGVKNGFVYDIKNSNNNSLGKIIISIISDTVSEGYFITPPTKIKQGSIAVFDESIDMDENPLYAVCLEPEIKIIITLIEKDICYAQLPELNNIARGQQFVIKDHIGEEAGTAELLEIVPKGTSIFRIIGKQKMLAAGYTLNSIQRNMSAWKNLGIELSTNPVYFPSALYAFYKAYEFDKKNPAILQGFSEQAKLLARMYEKGKQNFKALRVYRQCDTITGECKDELKNLLPIIKNEADTYWEYKNLLLAIKTMEMFDADPEIQKKLSTCYNNEATLYSYNENPDYQIYLYKRAFEINPQNFLAAKNLINLHVFKKNYISALGELQIVIKNTNLKKENKEWIEKKIIEVERLEKGLIYNYSLKTLNQQNIEIASLKGNVVLFIQWSMMNQNSVQALDFLSAFYKQFKSKPFKLFAINIDPRDSNYIEDMKNFMRKYEDYDFNVVYSEENLENLFKLNALPENVLIDKEGKIVYQDAGNITDELENLIIQLLK